MLKRQRLLGTMFFALTLISFNNCGEPVTSESPFAENLSSLNGDDCLVNDYDCLINGNKGNPALLDMLMTIPATGQRDVAVADTRVVVQGMCNDGGFAYAIVELAFFNNGQQISVPALPGAPFYCERGGFAFEIPVSGTGNFFRSPSYGNLFEVQLTLRPYDEDDRPQTINQVNGVGSLTLRRLN